MKNYLIIIGLSICSTGFGQGNVDGFFKSKGDLDVALSGTYGRSTTYFAGTNPIKLERNQLILGAYANYGLSDKWNVVVSVPLINFDLQDAALFTKYKLFQKRKGKGEWTIAPAFGVTFPLSNYETQSGQAIGQRATTFQPKLIFQFKADKNWFVQAQSGYNYSLNPVPSSIPASIKVGYIYNKWYFDAWFDYQYGIGGIDYQGGVAGTFRELGVSYNRVGGVVYRSMGDRWGLFLNGSYVVSGRNIGQMYAIGTGAVLKFNLLKKKK